MTLTKGYGLMSHSYKRHKPLSSFTGMGRHQGVLVASESGMVTSYALEGLEARGVMFVTPGTQVYEGMIVGENKYARDLVVNVAKIKALSNVRMSTKEAKVVLKAPRTMSLENCLAYLNEDELLEITPASYRMRKAILKDALRKKNYADSD
jgi:GTP-binding protein